METYNFTICASLEQRLDHFLTENLPLHSRSYIQKLIKKGQVTVNNQAVKTGYNLKKNDKIRVIVPEPEPTELEPESISLDIFYEDEDLIIINKPAGLVVHPGPGNRRHTLVHALLAHCQSLSAIGGVERPGIVHRLDKDTSGLLMVAKNDRAHRSLSRQLSERTILREYLAISLGRFKEKEGQIDLPIGRHPQARKKMAIVERGRQALTTYVVEAVYEECSLLRLRLKTGRTHQIRLHLKAINHPILNDTVYGGKALLQIKQKRLVEVVQKASGLLLHAEKLGFVHPSTGEFLTFEADLPEYFKKILHFLQS